MIHESRATNQEDHARVSIQRSRLRVTSFISLKQRVTHNPFTRSLRIQPPRIAPGLSPEFFLTNLFISEQRTVLTIT